VSGAEVASSARSAIAAAAACSPIAIPAFFAAPSGSAAIAVA
jgi:hypothetical protein